MSEWTHKAGARGVPTVGTAWLAALAISAVLLTMVGLASPSTVLADPGAGPAIEPPSQTPVSFAELEEELEEAGDEESEDEEEGEDFFEADEVEEEGEAEDESPFPPDECVLRTARSQVFAYPAQDRVRLLISYTALAPAEVAVDYRLAGRKGSLGLGWKRRHLATQGRLQLTAHLSEAKMDVVEAARSFTVDTDIVAAPAYCRRFYTRHLGLRHGGRSRLVWSQSDSIFGL
jgi:hypothetical protein